MLYQIYQSTLTTPEHVHSSVHTRFTDIIKNNTELFVTDMYLM